MVTVPGMPVCRCI